MARSSQRQPPRFGTDGWRGEIARDFTFDNVERLARAAGEAWLAETAACGGDPRVVVGYDTRFLSAEFAQAAAEVLAAGGIEVVLASCPTPTPAVSWAVRQLRAAGGIMITASHNPPRFNGFKLKAAFGGSADAAFCRAVESRWREEAAERMPLEEARRAGRVRVRDLRPAHLRQVRRVADWEAVGRRGWRIAHDAMHGVGAGGFEALLAGTACRVTTLRAEPDPLFGGVNPEPIPRYYGPTVRWLRRNPQDVCLVTDGDADRIGALTGRGAPLTTHQVISLVLDHFARHRGAKGRVLKSVNTTSMVDDLCAWHGLELEEVGIGFKYMCRRMLEPGVLLGVEESGGIAWSGHLPERDGLAAGMWLLEAMTVRGRLPGQLLGELTRRFGPRHYDRVGLRLPPEEARRIEAVLQADPPSRLLRSPVERVVTIDGLKLVARNGSWLMLRASGTEPLLRIYAEASSPEQVRRLLALGRRWVRQVG
ncbi:MAG: phosphoglucomutase/phosphomannomutase family protein [Verrucomicrobia bacterium]|nr:MAG: phosphoglucomutase/phosphomannomutase family protein [Verrucomicrobiota bacterium]